MFNGIVYAWEGVFAEINKRLKEKSELFIRVVCCVGVIVCVFVLFVYDRVDLCNSLFFFSRECKCVCVCSG